jgi:hypothetical protein
MLRRCPCPRRWGEVDAEDWKLNDESVQDGSRILSAYRILKGEKLWIIPRLPMKTATGRRPPSSCPTSIES